jgi:hypothetical protein
MKTLTNISRVAVLVTGTLQIILGVIIWFGVADVFILVHILSGIILVLGLWTLAIIAGRMGMNLGFVAFAIAWGLMAVILGITHDGLIPGQAHWIIQVLHLIVGLIVIGLAQLLGAQIKRKFQDA